MLKIKQKNVIKVTEDKKNVVLNQGITLISLIITVILLLILAGITLNLTLGNNGIFTLSKNASKNYINAQNKELADLEKLYSEMKIATNDGSSITVSIEELNKIIEAKVEEKLNEQQSEKQTNLVPDYSNRVDILSYNSESNQYMTPKDGYILIPTFASIGGENIYIFFDDNCVTFLGNTNTGYIRDSICLPISKDTKVYYKIVSDNNNYHIDYGCWFIPSK